MYKEISDNDFVARYCAPGTLDNDVVQSTAFKLRYNERYVSVNWIHKDLNIKEELENIRSAFDRKGFIRRENGRFLILNVGMIKHHIYTDTGIKISIHHRTSHNDPTHAGIWIFNQLDAYERKKQMSMMADSLAIFIHKNPIPTYPAFV